MATKYCTLFDSRYVVRGLAMLASLEPYREPDDEVFVLAMDSQAKRIIERESRGRWQLLVVGDMKDQELAAVAERRPYREFCWTCTPALAAWLVRNSAEGEIVVYLDADLWFFRDPRILLRELEDDGTILVHEHRFSSDRAAWDTPLYRFNVGFLAYRVGAEARACVERWRAQVIECCELDPENGYVGDQGYLAEWPQRYAGLRVMRHIGGGVAPWNVSSHQVGRNGFGPTVDGEDVVFFHFHALRLVGDESTSVLAMLPAAGYQFAPAIREELYLPYAEALATVIERMRASGMPIEVDEVVNEREIELGVSSGTYLKVYRAECPEQVVVVEEDGILKRLALSFARRYPMDKFRWRMKLWGYSIARASEWGIPADRLDLSGDRDVEWAWTAAHIPDNPGRVLDLGPATSTTPMIAAFSATDVIAFDLSPPDPMSMPFSVPGLTYVKGDILNGGLPEGQFDTIINCSTTEHIGLSGRYGSTEDPDGDLKAMAIMRERMSGPHARMVFTIPVGLDSVERPYHRIYGRERLPRVLSGFKVLKEAYYAKPEPPNVWRPVSKDVALSVKGSPSFYGLGLFVLAAE